MRDAEAVPVADRPAEQRACLDCGTALRRTNGGSRCGACAARAGEGHAVPQAFWYAEDVAAALAQWDLPAVVRLIHAKLRDERRYVRQQRSCCRGSIGVNETTYLRRQWVAGCGRHCP